jgi:hypothetical protein
MDEALAAIESVPAIREQLENEFRAMLGAREYNH